MLHDIPNMCLQEKFLDCTDCGVLGILKTMFNILGPIHESMVPDCLKP